MALLQAARAYVLGLPLESAYSWGLNRAIVIAAAKKGFTGEAAKEGKTSKAANVYYLGDDMAYKDEGSSQIHDWWRGAEERRL